MMMTGLRLVIFHSYHVFLCTFSSFFSAVKRTYSSFYSRSFPSSSSSSSPDLALDLPPIFITLWSLCVPWVHFSLALPNWPIDFHYIAYISVVADRDGICVSFKVVHYEHASLGSIYIYIYMNVDGKEGKWRKERSKARWADGRYPSSGPNILSFFSGDHVAYIPFALLFYSSLLPLFLGEWNTGFYALVDHIWIVVGVSREIWQYVNVVLPLIRTVLDRHCRLTGHMRTLHTKLRKAPVFHTQFLMYSR